MANRAQLLTRNKRQTKLENKNYLHDVTSMLFEFEASLAATLKSRFVQNSPLPSKSWFALFSVLYAFETKLQRHLKSRPSELKYRFLSIFLSYNRNTLLLAKPYYDKSSLIII